MSRNIVQKWRPTLGMILAATLAAVLCLPLAGIVAVRNMVPLIGYGNAVILVSSVVVASTGVLGFVLWRILLRPIRTLAARAQRIKQGDPHALDALPHYGTVEMKALGQAMLDMGRVLQGREAVLRSYADHVTHELKSPLTVLRGAAELLDTPRLPAAERRKLLDRIDDAADRMTLLLDAQRALAKAQDPAAGGHCRLADILPALVRNFQILRINVLSDGPMPMSAEALNVVLEHLLGNALAHGASEIELSVGPEVLIVADNGSGVSKGNRDRIFDPFFTTRRDKGGTGMGLSIVRRMLEAHGAEISLDPVGRGATFRIEF